MDRSRLHTGSDLKIFLTWCASQGLDPLRVCRADIERYVRWLQEARCYQPSTMSRRLSVVVGFYRLCVIDQMLPYSPADYVRRPATPSPHSHAPSACTGDHSRQRPAALPEPLSPAAVVATLLLLGP